MIRIGTKDKKAVEMAADVIKKGGLVLYPSDTVYILAVDATNKSAVEKLIGFKDRWAGKAISVAVLDEVMASEYVELDDNAKRLYSRLLPGPFTIISKGKHKTAKGIEAENGTLGIRIPDSKLIADLVRMVGKPISATSANLSGRSPHYSVESLLGTLSKKKMEMLDLIVDGGRLPNNKPSTVIDISESEIKVLRRGDVVTGKSGQTVISKSEKETGKVAEFIVKKIIEKSKDDKAIVLALTGDLGCGKTVFSRSVARMFGVEGKITSPTFFIFNEYEITKSKTTLITKFLHFDLYRIRDKHELDEINFFDLFEKGSVACVEWPENMGEEALEELKKKVNWVPIKFEYIEENTREIQY